MPKERMERLHDHVRTYSLDTAGVAKTILVNKQPTDVCWLMASPETPGTAGLIQVYDGFDAGGRLVLQLELAYTRHPVFIPRLACLEALFISSGAGIACWTAGYCLHCSPQMSE